MQELPPIPQDIAPDFTPSQAATFARVSVKRIFQILRERGIREHCRIIGNPTKPTLILIPNRFRPLFAVHEHNLTRREAGRLGGRARSQAKTPA